MKAVLLLSLILLAATARAAPASRDITLDDCLRIAIDHNPQIRNASLQFLAAQGQALKLHAILYPTATAQALTAPTTLYVQINQVLYSRATYPQLRISRLAQDQAVINYRQILDDVIFQVRQAFVSELGARAEDKLIHDFITSQSRASTTARQLFQAGQIQKSAVLSVQVTDNLLAQRGLSSQLSITQARLALDNLLGQDLPADGRLVGRLTDTAPADLDKSALIAEALRNRADLKLLESLRLTQQQQILVNLNNALPIVGFSSNSAFQPPDLGGISDFDLERNYNEPEVQRQEGNSQLPLSLYFTWVIFDGGNLAGQRMSGQAQLESQEVAIRALKQSIPGEVASAVSAIGVERAALAEIDSTSSPDELRHSAELDYQAGRIRQLDLVNLEGDLLRQQQTRLASEVRLNLAMAALDHALGRGLQTNASPLEHP